MNHWLQNIKINLRNEVAALAQSIVNNFNFANIFSKCNSYFMSLMWIFNYYVRWVSGRCSRFKWSTLHNRNIFASDCIHRIPCIAVYRTGWLLICGKLPKAQITNLFKLICMLNSIRSNNCQMQINLLEIDLPQYIHWLPE